MDMSEYSLKWSNHGSSLAAASSHLLEDGALADVTLSAEGQQLQAHKFILAVSSPYFKQILMNNPCQHPVIILRDVPALDVQYLLLFIYQGHVNVPHSCLSRFIELAKALEIVGLAQVDPSSDTLQSISDGQPRKRRRTSDEVPACEDRLSPGLQLKAEIQDMLEVKLETDESVDSPPAPLTNCAPDSCRLPTPPALPALPTAAPAPPTDSNRPILPKPDSLDDSLYSNHNMRLRIPSSLQPEFPLDPSCLKLPFPCPFCDKAYMSWGFRRRHIKVCHSSPSQLPCKWCPAVQASSLQWQAHVQEQHLLSASSARNGLLILEEALMVLQFAAPTRITSIVELIKGSKSETSAAPAAEGNAVQGVRDNTAGHGATESPGATKGPKVACDPPPQSGPCRCGSAAGAKKSPCNSDGSLEPTDANCRCRNDSDAIERRSDDDARNALETRRSYRKNTALSASSEADEHVASNGPGSAV